MFATVYLPFLLFIQAGPVSIDDDAAARIASGVCPDSAKEKNLDDYSEKKAKKKIRKGHKENNGVVSISTRKIADGKNFYILSRSSMGIIWKLSMRMKKHNISL